MRSAILEKGKHSYTHMNKVFQVIGNEQLKYNWLITNFECYPQDGENAGLFSEEYVWISGNRLTEIIQKEDFQFIWGVLSGFSKDVTLEEILKYDFPLADENEGFSKDDVKIQHPLADIEIVAWDSSLTLFISKDDSLFNKFRKGFPLSEDLSAQNLRDNSEIVHMQELMIQELTKRDIDINDEILYQKYFIWNKLYSERKNLIEDSEILYYIRKIIN
jgi:hypothetical protein